MYFYFITNLIKVQQKIADKIEQENENITVEVINARFLKPIDKETIGKSIEKTKNVITIEDGTIINGLATAVDEIINEKDFKYDIKIKNYAYPDEFIKHGEVSQLEKIYGLDEDTIMKDFKAEILIK